MVKSFNILADTPNTQAPWCSLLYAYSIHNKFFATGWKFDISFPLQIGAQSFCIEIVSPKYTNSYLIGIAQFGNGFKPHTINGFNWS